MGLFKKSLLMSEVRLHDERIGLSLGTDTLRLFLHTDTQTQHWELLRNWFHKVTRYGIIPTTLCVRKSNPQGQPSYPAMNMIQNKN